MSEQAVRDAHRTASRWPGRLALVGLGVEVAVTVYVLTHLPKETLEQWLHLLIPIAAFAVGGLVSVVMFLVDPRSRRAQLSFGLHGAAVLFVVLAWKYHQYQHEKLVAIERKQRAAEHAQAQRNVREVAELTTLVKAYDYSAALQYLRAHPPLQVGNGAPLTQVLCPPDKREPNLALLKELTLHGAPTGGDLLVHSAQCSLRSFQTVMRLGIPANARSRSMAQSALSTARSPELISFLVQAGLDVNARDDAGRTPLMLHRSAAVTRALLQHGADARAVDSHGRSALHYAGPPEQLAAIFALLIEAGADVTPPPETTNQTPLVALASSRAGWSQAAADLLVEHGAKPSDQRAAVRQLLWDGTAQGEPPFPIAPCLSWPGLDLADQGGSLLLTALQAERPDVVELLLSRGANPRARRAEEGYSLLSALDAEWLHLKVGADLRAKILAAAKNFPAQGGADSDAPKFKVAPHLP